MGARVRTRTILAERLRVLFTTIANPATGRRYTCPEVAAAIEVRAAGLSAAERAGRMMTAQEVAALLDGVETNPMMTRVDALADLFGMPIDYFLDDAAFERIRADLEVEQGVHEPSARGVQVEDLALRAQGLSTASIELITRLIEHVRRLERPDEVGLRGSSAVIC